MLLTGTYTGTKCPFSGTVSIRGRILAGTCHNGEDHYCAAASVGQERPKVYSSFGFGVFSAYYHSIGS